MLSNLLERRIAFGQTSFDSAQDRLGSAPPLTSTQLEINQIVDGLNSSASDWKTLASMSLGSFAFKLGKLATMGGVSSKVLGTSAGLLAEVATFRSSEALLHGQSIQGAFEGKGFAATVLNFGLLKGTGSVFRNQNQILVHALQSGAMVAGHELGARLSLVETQSGTLIEKLVRAEVMNVQMQAGASLVHATLPGLVMRERVWGLRSETVGANLRVRPGRHTSLPLQQERSLPLMASELSLKPEDVVSIPGGRFVMGSRGLGSFENETPRLVEVSPFRMSRTPNTNAMRMRYWDEYESTPFAIIGRDQNGIWRVVQRGKSEMELESWLRDPRRMEDVWIGDQGRFKCVRSGGNAFIRDFLFIKRVIPKNQKLPKGFEDFEQPTVHVDWVESVSIASAMGGHLPTEAQWEFAARGSTVNVTEQLRVEGVTLEGFVDFVRGPLINGRNVRGYFGRYENFVALNSTTMEIGREMFMDSHDIKLQKMLKDGQAIGAWRVFSTESGAFEQSAIWSSVESEKSVTRPVMESKAGPFGSRDMSGNVLEWTNDVNSPYREAAYLGEVIKNPTGLPDGYTRVLRGSGWDYSDPRYLRASFRSGGGIERHQINIGFRAVFPPE